MWWLWLRWLWLDCHLDEHLVFDAVRRRLLDHSCEVSFFIHQPLPILLHRIDFVVFSDLKVVFSMPLHLSKAACIFRDGISFICECHRLGLLFLSCAIDRLVCETSAIFFQSTANDTLHVFCDSATFDVKGTKVLVVHEVVVENRAHGQDSPDKLVVWWVRRTSKVYLIHDDGLDFVMRVLLVKRGSTRN